MTFDAVTYKRATLTRFIIRPTCPTYSTRPTGSTRAGKRVVELSAGTLKRVRTELGGKSAALMLDDADLEAQVGPGHVTVDVAVDVSCDVIADVIAHATASMIADDTAGAIDDGTAGATCVMCVTRVSQIPVMMKQLMGNTGQSCNALSRMLVHRPQVMTRSI